MEVQDILFDGVDAIKFWHICYGSVDGQRDVFEGKAAKMMSLFKISNADVILMEFTSKGFDELAAFKTFPKDRVLESALSMRRTRKSKRRSRSPSTSRKGSRWFRRIGFWWRLTAGSDISAARSPMRSFVPWVRRPGSCGRNYKVHCH